MYVNNSILDPHSTLYPVAIAAFFTLVLAAYTVITIFLFEKLRAKFFMRIVGFISLSDFLAIIVYFVPMHNSNWCYLQGIVQNYFFLTSVMWAAVLTFVVDKLFKFSRVELSKSVLYSLYAICWGYPLIPSCLSLITMKYEFVDEPFQFKCTLVPRDHSKQASWNNTFWVDVMWAGPLILCIIYMYVTGLLIVYKLYTNKSLHIETLKIVVGNLFLYPVVMAVAWIPYISYLIFVFTLKVVSTSNLEKTKDLVIAGDVFTVLNGALSGLIFILRSKDGLECWKRLIFAKDTTVINETFVTNFIQNPTGTITISNFEDYYVDEESYGNYHNSGNGSERSSFDSSNSNSITNIKAVAPVVNIEVLDSNMRRQGSVDVDTKIVNRRIDNNNPLMNTLI